MNVAMFTNTFAPHLGGVARSVAAFTGALRCRGHRTMVFAPAYERTRPDETDIVRLPAWKHFSTADFSVPLPVPAKVTRNLDILRPQIMHAHHPFLLGETALRAASARQLPVVFTHHTLYERYTHYLPRDSPRLQHFVSELAAGFCNLCDAVIAPSQSVAQLLRTRGVCADMEVIPTGVDLELFRHGDGRRFRQRLGIPGDALVIGHLGRLAPEKEPLFLARAVARHLRHNPGSHFLLIGIGPCAEEMEQLFATDDLNARFHRLPTVEAVELASAYAAMDVFAFASQSETQGMVLTEAMAAGAVVVAVDGPGVRDVLCHERNGRLVAALSEELFSEALQWFAGLSQSERQTMRQQALATAGEFSLDRSVEKLIALYQRLVHHKPAPRLLESSRWAAARRFLDEEFKILRNLARAREASLARREPS